MKIKYPFNKVKLIQLVLNIISILTMLAGIATLMVAIDTHNRIQPLIESTISNLGLQDGKTPIAGVDFPLPKNGKNGENGEDSISTHTEKVIVEKETVIKETPGEKGYSPIKGVDYFDGKTTISICDEKKNRWIYRIIDEDQWYVIYDPDGLVIPCKTD